MKKRPEKGLNCNMYNFFVEINILNIMIQKISPNFLGSQRINPSQFSKVKLVFVCLFVWSSLSHSSIFHLEKLTLPVKGCKF